MLVRRTYIPHRSRPERWDRWPYTVPCVADLVAQWRRYLTDPDLYLRQMIG